MSFDYNFVLSEGVCIYTEEARRISKSASPGIVTETIVRDESSTSLPDVPIITQEEVDGDRSVYMCISVNSMWAGCGLDGFAITQHCFPHQRTSCIEWLTCLIN